MPAEIPLTEFFAGLSQRLMTTHNSILWTTNGSFVPMQAILQFYVHEQTMLKTLANRILGSTLGFNCKDYTLVVHDWSVLNYNKHESKHDRRLLRLSNIEG